jgi:hypothetical protein
VDNLSRLGVHGNGLHLTGGSTSLDLFCSALGRFWPFASFAAVQHHTCYWGKSGHGVTQIAAGSPTDAPETSPLSPDRHTQARPGAILGARGPKVKATPLSVSMMLKMPASEIALLLYRRCPSKMFAMMRAMEELAATGSAAKPVSGWAAARQRPSIEAHP